MENTLENKAKFFAQYHGQRIARRDGKLNLNPSEMVIEKDYLELKPLSSITDEDLNFIMKDEIMNPDPAIGDPVFTFEVGGLKLSDLTTNDYLRSKGYALPWMGLSIEKLVEYGWVKLKEN